MDPVGAIVDKVAIVDKAAIADKAATVDKAVIVGPGAATADGGKRRSRMTVSSRRSCSSTVARR
jgi:hypothetical protein